MLNYREIEYKYEELCSQQSHRFRSAVGVSAYEFFTRPEEAEVQEEIARLYKLLCEFKASSKTA